MGQFQALDMRTLCERICQNKRTLIVYHVRSDADAVGSAFALRELLRVMGIPAICYGCYAGGGAHTREEYVEIDSLLPGLQLAFDQILYHF